MNASGNPISTRSLIIALRLIADGEKRMTVGVRTTCSLAADRLTELNEKLESMTGQKKTTDEYVTYGGDLKDEDIDRDSLR